MGFSITNHPFWGSSICGNHVMIYRKSTEYLFVHPQDDLDTGVPKSRISLDNQEARVDV